ncbi:hypothetical protein [Companilactobacillus nantensis]|uniref:Uncharacterized protein n=1 Tax=Companilactobacillus nantensis DSM 16982 TaxID=1423774 RepID=A0A0R1WE24_9LACO|nr:hypothetical protein [Companilactobacillus nantensis]KRM16065.1 hypothetical protein FD31_GL000740 [Companilactobacillus nantensis DSM 16982]GEO63854.1 hypothetical protein LNA01_10370 [Companilactobacillus nantensis]
MIIAPLFIILLLLAIAIVLCIIGFKITRKSTKFKKSTSDIENLQLSINLARKYPQELRHLKKIYLIFLISYLVILMSLAAIIAGLYMEFMYSDQTITSVGFLIAFVSIIVEMIFLRKLLLLRIKMQTNLKESSDEQNQQRIIQYIASNQNIIEGQKYISIAFALIFIIVFIIRYELF